MLKRQEGMAGISMMIMLIGIVFFISLAYKVIPVYVDDGAVQSIVESFDNKADMRGKNTKSVLAVFEKRVRINSLYNFEMENVSLKKKGKDYIMVVDYESRGELIGSLEYIVHFRHEAKFAAN